MSVVLRTRHYALYRANFGMIQFEHENGSTDGDVSISFISWGFGNFAKIPITTYGLPIFKEPRPYTRPVAREIWKTLIEDGWSEQFEGIDPSVSA